MSRFRVVLIVVALAVLPTWAGAQTTTSFGPRFGASIKPDQLVLGAQLSIEGLSPNLTLDPNIELGVLDDITTIQFNFDGQYHFAIEGSDWRPSLGLGIGIANYSIDRAGEDISNTEVGINLILGTNVPTSGGNRWFAEMRFGAGNLPDLKLLAGVNFPM